MGPGTDIIAGCRPANAGDPLIALILNRTNGAIVATVAGGGGGDQIEYDAATNRYYNAASRWIAGGTNKLGGGCSATNVCSPSITIIDAASRTVALQLPTGNNAHGLAVDGVNKKVFNPISSAATPAGCGTCKDTHYVLPGGGVSDFTNGGVAIFATQ